jgi:hypothetical protein
MKTLELGSYLESVQARKATLSADSAMLAAEPCRNGGSRRTASKRSTLARAEARANAAGVKPVRANY